MIELKKHNVISPATVSRLVEIAKYKERKAREKRQEELNRHGMPRGDCNHCQWSSFSCRLLRERVCFLPGSIVCPTAQKGKKP